MSDELRSLLLLIPNDRDRARANQLLNERDDDLEIIAEVVLEGETLHPDTDIVDFILGRIKRLQGAA